MIKIGQYYKAVIIDEDGQPELFISPWEFDNGAKLMEHSWLGNDFIRAVETLLVAEAPRRVVWAGDYADAEMDAEGNPLIIKSDMYTAGEGDANLYCLTEALEPYRPDVPGLGDVANYDWLTKAGKQRVKPKITHTKDPEVPPNAFPTVIPTLESHPYLLNWDKRVYVDKRKVPAVRYYYSKEKSAIHPLPLLTVEGNGRGGGDFHTDNNVFGTRSDRSPARGNFSLIGSWARDHILLSSKVPEGEWSEIDFDLVEMGVDETAADKAANKPMRAFMRAFA